MEGTGTEQPGAGTSKGAQTPTTRKGNGKAKGAQADRKARRIPEHMKDLAAKLHANYDEILKDHLEDLERALKLSAKSCSLTFTVSARTRKDLDIELTCTGKASLPHVGDTFKTRLEDTAAGQQLRLL